MRDAIALVCVMGDDITSAEQLARGYVLDQGWIVEEVQAAHAPTPQQLARLDNDMHALHHQALKRGIYGIFATHRLLGECDFVEIRPLYSPYFSGSS